MAVSAAMKKRVKARILADKKKGKGDSGAKKRKSRQSELQAAERREEARLAGLLDSAVADRFGGVERELGQETRRVGAHGATIDQAYASYQSTVAQLQAQQQAAMAQAAQAQAQVATGVAGAQTALGTGQQAQTQQTAQQYGLDGGAQAAEAAKLSGQLGAVQGARAQAQAGSTAAIGLAQGERLTGAALGGVAGQQRDKKRNQDELALLSGKALELADQKGAFRGTLRQQIRQQEQEQRLAEAALGIKATESDRDHELAMLNTKVKQDEARAKRREESTDNRRADRALDHQINASTRAARQKDRELDIRAKEDAKGPAAKLTPAKKDEWKRKKHRIMEAQRRFQSLLGTKGYETTGEITAHLKKQGFSHSEINMARDLAIKHRLSATNREAAKAYFPGGIIPGGFITQAP
jgi:hypothetical protein